MCGIAGFIDFKCETTIEDVNKMAESIAYRGPDHSGTFFCEEDGAYVGFSHNRLAILDLTTGGHQPMYFEDLVIVYNGEIYNFEEIKVELVTLGHAFISKSDTEVILHAFTQWGQDCVSKFIGMFSFVILNKKDKSITLFRDRAGVKPLFYYWDGNFFLFASELKTFHEFKQFKKEINLNAVNLYMDFGYVPSPFCIFKNCNKLQPGHILRFNLITKNYSIYKYWDVNDYYNKPKLNISYNEAKEKVEALLKSAFEYRMVADVPIGVFLSGGYDSTAVAAILQNGRQEKIKTYTIGFEIGQNEAPFANEIAKHIGTDHTEVYCSTKDALDIIPDLPYYFDEPFADSSAVPTILVSRIARKHVTVILSADAGDEIFAGYNYYRSFQKTASLLLVVPYSIRRIAGFCIKIVYQFMPESSLKLRLNRLVEALRADNRSLPFILHKSYFKLPGYIRNKLFSINVIKKMRADDIHPVSFDEVLSVALAIDYKMYLQNDILTKVDRATMSISLEGREPFLDHRIVEFVAQLPYEYKFGDIQKRILKDIVHKYVPKAILDRPKLGFEMPVSEWLKKELSYLLDDYLNEEAINKSGIFDPAYVRNLHCKFLKDKVKDPLLIWKLLQFQMWYKKWMN
jgi:asparagine synthase (glutamine-hydrolysing)